MLDLGPVALTGLAIVLAYVNGLHDASNAVSTSIATRTLSERAALVMAAVLSFLGALLGIGLLGWTAPVVLGLLGVGADGGADASSLPVLLGAALVATIIWNLLTWWRGMPSSTWHAMFGATAGAALVLGLPVSWTGEVALVVSILLSPLLAGMIAYALVLVLARLTSRRGIRTRHLRVAQTISAGAVAAGHGLHDSRLPMAVIAVVLAAQSQHVGTTRWYLLALAVALALGAGTLAGGYRIIRTLATRLTDLSTAQGLAAETAAAALLCATTLGMAVPISTSHAVTAGIVSSGMAVSPRAVRWPLVGRIVLTWLLTPCAAGLIGAVLALMLSGLGSS